MLFYFQESDLESEILCFMKGTVSLPLVSALRNYAANINLICDSHVKECASPLFPETSTLRHEMKHCKIA